MQVEFDQNKRLNEQLKIAKKAKETMEENVLKKLSYCYLELEKMFEKINSDHDVSRSVLN